MGFRTAIHPLGKTFVIKKWTRPNLSSNGILGGKNFAIYDSINAGTSYQLVDGNWNSMVGHTHLNFNIILYNPNPLCINSVGTACLDGGAYLKGANLYGSNDNINYTLMTSFSNAGLNYTHNFANKKYYRYYKIQPTQGGNYNNYCHIREIYLTATQRLG